MFATARYTAIQGLYWGVYCVIIAFASVFLLSRGFTNTQIGIVVAAGGALSAVLQPAVSGFAGRFVLRRFTGALIVGLAVLTVLSGIAPAMLLLAVLYAVLIIVLQLIQPLTSALGLDAINCGIPLDFGASRGAGSISYGVLSSVLGVLVLKFGENCLPAATLLLTLLLLISVLTFRFSGTAAGKPAEEAAPARAEKSSGHLLAQYPGLLLLLIGIALMLLSHNIINVFMFQIVTPLGGDSADMGRVLLVQSLIELPIMFGFSHMLKVKGAALWLRLSGIGFFLHALATQLSPSVGALYPAQIFEANGYALFILAAAFYLNEKMRPEHRVQGQAYLAIAITMGNVIASLGGGVLLDALGVRALLMASTVTGAAGMVIVGRTKG